jgi:hypothetical protein
MHVPGEQGWRPIDYAFLQARPANSVIIMQIIDARGVNRMGLSAQSCEGPDIFEWAEEKNCDIPSQG